jgi:hypothetical protein
VQTNNSHNFYAVGGIVVTTTVIVVGWKMLLEMMMVGPVNSSSCSLLVRRRLALYRNDRRANIVHDELNGIDFAIGIPQGTAAVEGEHSALDRVIRAFQIVRNGPGCVACRRGDSTIAATRRSAKVIVLRDV